ncbi:hypothetical protein [Campylobacter estrildidarum]|uniref:Uroporphyrinogen III synthase HEM4 n=1 Tax=Campylobacter estrildidarum TaxID=2510189 RepID=A0A4U7BHY5_9BACT|nr:hypothetical protein [Campylobacter estrildidarum]TKX31069.1 hypothetical protein CQA69_03730 [Campylobacter estrildidarum]
MKIKLFLSASLVYTLVIFAFAWYLKLGSYALNFSTYNFELPIMIWLILPLFPLIFFAIFHMLFYHFLLTLKFKHFFKDASKFETYTQDLLLEKESDISFYTKEFRKVAQLAKTLKNHEKIPNETKINEILDLIDGINREEYLNIRKFKLSNDNILFLENEKNHIKNDIDYAYSRVKHLDEIKDEFEELAFETLLKKGNYEQIKNVKIPKNPHQILNLIKRFQEGNLELSVAEFEVLLTHSSLNEKEYLNIAKMSTKFFNPDAILGIFSKIKNEKNEALRAYLYLLAEFELLDELREQIRKDEKKFSDFKAFLILKENNIKFDLNNLIQ